MQSTVLVVEDDETLRSLTADAVALLGLAVSDRSNADEALALLENSSSIALVITDVNMPGRIDGLDLARIIWRRWPSVPVIITSQNELVKMGQLPPHISFLPKPWTLDVFHRAVRKALG